MLGENIVRQGKKLPPPFLNMVTLEYKRTETPSQVDLLTMASKCVHLLETRQAPKYKVGVDKEGIVTEQQADLKEHLQGLQIWEFLTNLCMGERAASKLVHPELDEAKKGNEASLRSEELSS